MADSVTAVDYLEHQLALEREAREIMPYEPDACTYPKILRQLVFACLTCQRQNGTDVAVCYLCLIQCHSTHDLVELFSKRNIACDCGTTRMQKGAGCKLRAHSTTNPEPRPRLRTGSSSLMEPLRSSELDLKADDIPVLDNTYNQNYKGLFCLCNVLYNPLVETRTMHQCYLGDVCGEDWFHQDCIMGFGPEMPKKHESGLENKLDLLLPPGADALTEANENPSESAEDETVTFFPELNSFSEFVCWKCVTSHKDAFEELLRKTEKIGFKLPRFENTTSAEEWKSHADAFSDCAPPLKKSSNTSIPFSVMFRPDFKAILAQLTLDEETAAARLLRDYPFLAGEDPTYEPEEDTESVSSNTSLFELGANALLSLPGPQAIEGLHAYGKLKDKLKGFLQNFVDQKKVVTEEEVREFFGNMEKE